MIDAQSVKTSASVPAAGQSTDAGKKIVGRKQNDQLAGSYLPAIVAVGDQHGGAQAAMHAERQAHGEPSARAVPA
ncbi:hypothetical protein GCM10010347_43700 [Streptomyces cirratus]|uniref:Uncharacterized protein n=1 Tax=Streptomyces cirratus TaxID=68187 RepID=A0ABQ3EWW6_9ACTN|nr:hypothetical protein GCM10010347_43700 [Streptomyces cirratus]